MLKESKDAIIDVIKLARDHRLYYEKQNTGSTFQEFQKFKESPEGKEVARRAELLDDYLNKLDFEIIKSIQVIMYLGRDEEYNKHDLPEEIYREQRKYFDSLGWNTKSIEINQMTEKLPLDQYLENGLNILGIRLQSLY